MKLCTVAIAIAVVAVLAPGCGDDEGNGNGAALGVGVCLTEEYDAKGNGVSPAQEVDCDDPAAASRVIDRAEDPGGCGVVGYVRDGEEIWCLEPTADSGSGAESPSYPDEEDYRIHGCEGKFQHYADDADCDDIRDGSALQRCVDNTDNYTRCADKHGDETEPPNAPREEIPNADPYDP